MKKITLFLFVILNVNFCFGQNEHLKFRDIDIDGHITEFISKLEKLGYSIQVNSDDTVMLKGSFIGRECDIFVQFSSKTKIVYGVMIHLPIEKSWYSFKREYQSVKEKVIQKYGKPRAIIESFKKPYYDGSGCEIQALKNGECVYLSVWDVKNGSIVLQIIAAGYLYIGYWDSSNKEVYEKKEKDIISSDL